MIHTARFFDDWDIHSTANFIQEKGYSRIALQFPDHLLFASSDVAAALLDRLGAGSGIQVFVLADSTYHSLGVDEVGAAHINADCVVHYGYASLAPVSTIPAFFVFPQHPLDVPQAASSLVQFASGCATTRLLVFPDQALERHMGELEAVIREQYEGPCSIAIARAAAHHLDPTGSRAGQQHNPQQPTEGTAGSRRDPVNCNESCASSTAACTNRAADGAGQAASQLSQLTVQECGACDCHRQPHAGADNAAFKDLTSGCRSDTLNIPTTDEAGPHQVEGNGCCGTSTMSSSSACCANSAGVGQGVPAIPTTSDAPNSMLQQRSGASTTAETDAPDQGHGDQVLSWRLPVGALEEPCSCVWLGAQDSPLLLPLQLTLNHLPWSAYDPQAGAWQNGVLPQVPALLKKRYYLVEKARGAHIVGLLVGTLGNSTCRPALDRVRKLAQAAGKKTYTILMGKPAPQKLANFPEIEVFVMLADPQGFILDSKDYYAPIITPYEAMLAFTGRPWTGKYSLEMEAVLNVDIDDEDLSSAADGAVTLSGAGALISQPNQGGKLVVKSAAQFLTNRSWQGLETPLTGAEKKPAELAQQGLTGRAATYTHEPLSKS